jgi:hypothetical protein
MALAVTNAAFVTLVLSAKIVLCSCSVRALAYSAVFARVVASATVIQVIFDKIKA